uniref:BAH domain-containing protein n=1 Tax=Kalanchoe fedtschenkoi TaxID=63787 RepID=A0A7N0TQY3_KALFE
MGKNRNWRRRRRKAADAQSGNSREELKRKSVGGDDEQLQDKKRKEEQEGSRTRSLSAFEYDGRRYELEDSVLVTPEEENTRPRVAIIKGISQSLGGSMFVTIQWFYHPEEVVTGDGESWLSLDNRELLISNRQEEVPVYSIMHKCMVHFLSQWKNLPDRKKHPGFLVHHFYDHLKRMVYRITDAHYMDSLQAEIHRRITETQSRLGWEEAPNTQHKHILT